MDALTALSVNEDARRRFEVAWRDGKPGEIDSFLPPAEDPQYASTLLELVLIEMEFLWKARGRPAGATLTDLQPTRTENYLRRFPRLRERSLILVLINHEYQLRHLHGDHPSVAEYRARFPEIVVTGAELEPTLSSAAGDAARAIPQIPGFEILGLLGRGAMGVVFKARQVALNRIVALKRILEGASDNPEHRARFRIEARALARLQHPHIVQIHEIGEHEGLPYLALEFVPGCNLAQYLGGTPQPARHAAQLVRSLAQAMHAAHECGILHRDLKPANVLLTWEGGPPSMRGGSEAIRAAPPLDHCTPKISDFGLARRFDQHSEQTQSGAVVGTPNYMAPEQAAGRTKDLGPAADVYALGAILYELLTGRPPFRGQTLMDTLQQVLHNEPVPPSHLQPKLPRDLETICLKCLSKEPTKRYASAAQLAEDLRRFLANEPILARRIGLLGHLNRWCRRQPALAATLAGATFVVIAVASVAFWSVLRERDRFQQERDRAEANLYRALVGEARAQREGRGTGWWWKALDNLGQARQLKVPNRDLAELRELAIECMGSPYPCMRIHPAWEEQARHTGPVASVAFAPDKRLVASAGNDRKVRLWAVPSGRPLAELEGHEGAVTAVAFHPRGQWVASGSRDGTVRLWDLRPLVEAGDGEDAALRRSLPGRVVDIGKGGEVSAVAFSPDGAWLAAACQDGTVRLFRVDGKDESTAAKVRTLSGHTRRVTCLAFSPTEPLLVSGGADRMLCFWDLRRDQVRNQVPTWNVPIALSFAGDGGAVAWSDSETMGLQVLFSDGKPFRSEGQLHTGYVKQVCYHPQGFVVAASRDGSLKCWRPRPNTNAFDELAVGRVERTPLSAAALSADGGCVVVGDDEGRVRLWELVIPPQRAILPSMGQSTVFLPGERRLATTTRVFDFKNGICPGEQSFDAPAIVSLAIHPGDALLACGTDRGRLSIWDRAQRRAIAEWEGHDGQVTSLAIDPGGRRLASASADGRVKLWHWDSRRLDRSLAPGIGLIHKVAWSRDGRYLTAAGERGVVLWDLHSDAAPSRLSEYGGEGNSVALGKDTLALCGPENTIEIRKLSSGERLHTLRGHAASVTALEFAPDGRRLASASPDGTVHLWDTDTGAQEARFSYQAGAIAQWIAFDPRGRYLTGHVGGTPMVWDLRSKGELPVAKLFAVSNPASSGHFTADGSTLLLAGGNVGVQSYRVADIEEKRAALKTPEIAGPLVIEPRRTVIFGTHLGVIWGVDASRDGRWIATVAYDRTVKLWDAHTRKLVRTLEGHTEALWCVAFSADAKYVASGSFRGVVKVWDVETGRELHEFRDHTKHLAAMVFHPRHPWLVTASDDGTIRVWDVQAGRGLGVLHRFASSDDGVHSLAFSPDGRWLAAGCTDRRIALWDFRELPAMPAPPRRLLSGHDGEVWAVGFSADGRYLASGSDHGVILLWDGATFERRVTLRGGTRQIRSVSFSDDGRLLAGAAYAGATIVWDLQEVRRSLGEMNLDW